MTVLYLVLTSFQYPQFLSWFARINGDLPGHLNASSPHFESVPTCTTTVTYHAMCYPTTACQHVVAKTNICMRRLTVNDDSVVLPVGPFDPACLMAGLLHWVGGSSPSCKCSPAQRDLEKALSATRGACL